MCDALGSFGIRSAPLCAVFGERRPRFLRASWTDIEPTLVQIDQALNETLAIAVPATRTVKSLWLQEALIQVNSSLWYMSQVGPPPAGSEPEEADAEGEKA